MNTDKNSYRQIMKATSLFGGVQVFTIIISIVRSKVIAILLGPYGMGIAGLLTSTLGFVSSLTSFGLATSAVKDVASAYQTGDNEKIRTTITVFRKWVWITGLLGTILTIIFSNRLSILTFGNQEYKFAFLLLSITLLIGQLNSGQNVLLQGMRQHKSLAGATILGSLLGLIITLPLYYFFKIKGIVPAILINSLLVFIISWYFVQKLSINQIYVGKKQIFQQGKDMLKMGFLLSLSSLISLGASYLVRLYIRQLGGLDEVGLYSAGFTIVSSYVGVVFTAMGTDYYPRLSTVANDSKSRTSLINQQAEIALLILAPIILIFIVFIKQVIILLYSLKFIEINDMILFAALGMFFKAASWTIGYLFLAKRENRVYFISEIIANIYILILNILFYKYWGLSGLGISFLISYFLVLIQVYLIAHYKFEFRFTSSFLKIFVFQLILSIFILIVVKYLSTIYSYIIGCIVIIIISIHSVKELDKRLDIKDIFSKIKNKE